MNCRQADERLSAYLDGELTPPEAEEVRRHLASCAACRAAFEQLQRTVQAVKDLPVVLAPKDFRARVMADVQSDAGTAVEKKAPRWRMLWPAAAAVLIAVVLALIGDRPSPRRPAKTAESLPEAAAEKRDAESAAMTVPTDEKMRSLDGVGGPRASASPQPVFHALDLGEEARPLADKPPGSAAKLGGLALKKESAETAGDASAEAVAQAPPVESDIAKALEGAAGTGDAQVWTVVAPAPYMARARLNALAVENRWHIMPEESLDDRKKGEAVVLRLVLNVPANQLTALAQTVKTLSQPPAKAVLLESARNGEMRKEAPALTAPAADMRGVATEEPVRTVAAARAPGRARADAERDTISVTVLFRSPESVIVPPEAAAIMEVETAPEE